MAQLRVRLLPRFCFADLCNSFELEPEGLAPLHHALDCQRKRKTLRRTLGTISLVHRKAKLAESFLWFIVVRRRWDPEHNMKINNDQFEPILQI